MAEHRRLGDRKDGRLLHSLTPLQRLIPYIMTKRNDAQIFYDESFNVHDVDKMLRKERVSGYKNIGMLHFIIANYVRCLSMLPGVNRFVAGRRIYARNTIDVVISLSQAVSADTERTSIKITFEPTDTIFDVYRKINQRIDEIRSGEISDDTADFADAFTKLPRPIMRILTGILDILDYFGWLPSSLMNISPYHGSLVIADTASLRIGPVYHHIYNFGNLPVFISFGAKHHKYEVNRHGEVEDNKYVDCRFVMDERIVDGHYYSQFLQAMRYIFKHPEITELPPSRINEDSD